MTEPEYVQTIRNAAQRYLDVIRDGAANRDGKRHLDRWQQIKEGLSPNTIIRLCDEWLGKERPMSGDLEQRVVEAVARAMCTASGIDPDHVAPEKFVGDRVEANENPAWFSYRGDALRHYRMHLALVKATAPAPSGGLEGGDS